MQRREVLMQSQKHPLLSEFLQWKLLLRKGVLGQHFIPALNSDSNSMAFRVRA